MGKHTREPLRRGSARKGKIDTDTLDIYYNYEAVTFSVS